MKRTMLWMLVVLLLAAVASPAAAGPLLADLISLSTFAHCGQLQVVGSLILVDLKLTGACAPANAPAVPNTHALCRVDLGFADTFVTNLVDTAPPALGRIVGTEGILRGFLPPGLEIVAVKIVPDGAFCNTNVNYVSGFKK